MGVTYYTKEGLDKLKETGIICKVRGEGMVFGIECAEDITRDIVTKAIAQYERTLVSYNTRYEQKYKG